MGILFIIQLVMVLWNLSKIIVLSSFEYDYEIFKCSPRKISSIMLGFSSVSAIIYHFRRICNLLQKKLNEQQNIPDKWDCRYEEIHRTNKSWWIACIIYIKHLLMFYKIIRSSHINLIDRKLPRTLKLP